MLGAKLSGSTRQKLDSTLRLSISCESACTAVVRGSVRVPKVGSAKAKTFRLKSVSAQIAKDARKQVKVSMSKSMRRAIGRAIRARKRVSAKLTVTVSGAGSSQTLTRTVRFRR